MTNDQDLQRQFEQAMAQLERQLADANLRIQQMIREIDQRDQLIADLQWHIRELETHHDIGPDHR